MYRFLDGKVVVPGSHVATADEIGGELGVRPADQCPRQPHAKVTPFLVDVGQRTPQKRADPASSD
jgi:hypothetical protein